MPVPTLSTVADTNSSTTILAANTDRRGATFQNTSSAILYLRFDGGTATATTGHSVQIAANGHYEMPTFDHYGKATCYTGLVTGIWASDSTGSCNITEWTD